MAEPLKSYPPVGSDDRFDSIRSRGRFLRRRRQTVLSSGVGGVLLVVLAAAVLLIPGANKGSNEQVVADGGDGAKASTTTTTTEAMPENMEVTFSAAKGVLDIEIADPRMPQPAGGDLPEDFAYGVQQCAQVGVFDSTGQPVAEGFGCNAVVDGENPEAPGTSDELQLRSNADNVMIGCPAVSSRIGPVDHREVPRRSLLTSTLPSDMATGEYTIQIVATSGIGDGCGEPGEGDPTQIENGASTEGSFRIP